MTILRGVRGLRMASLASLAAAVGVAVALSGCGGDKPRTGPIPTDAQDRVSRAIFPALHDTVGEYATLLDSTPIPVEGWGVVVGLPNTGSGDMDPKIRDLLIDQLVREGFDSANNGTKELVPEKILASREVAVVEVRGVIPPLARKGTTFDLVVNALPNSQATSLSGGLLWTTELKVVGLTLQGNDSSTLALGRGPVLIPSAIETAAGLPVTTQPGMATRAQRVGRVLGGGVCADDRAARLQLFTPSARMTRAIELTINGRFPSRDKIADAVDNVSVNLRIPPEYATMPGAFVDLVKHLYLRTEEPGFNELKAKELVEALKDPTTPHRELSLALQGLGRSILPDFIQPYYTANDPELRFWMARAGACIDDMAGTMILQDIVKDHASAFRRQALAGLIEATYGRDTARATVALDGMLNSLNTEDRILAYQGLLAIRSRAISTYSVGRKFLLDVVPADGPALIYITQADSPRIALIGRPLSLPAGSVYVSGDKLLTVSTDDPTAQTDADGGARPTAMVPVSVGGAKEKPARKEDVTLYWRSPLGDKTATLRTTRNLPELIARATWIPDPLAADFDPHDAYIGASYQRIAEMLADMCRDHTIEAQFVVQPAPPMMLTPTDRALSGRIEGSTRNDASRNDGSTSPGPTTAPNP